MTLTVGEVDISGASDTDLAPLVSLVNTVDSEIYPRHVDMSTEDFRMFAGNPGMEEVRVVAKDGDLMVATASFSHPDDGTTPDLLRCAMSVLPGHRRRGVGRTLLREAVDVAEEKGRSQLQGFAFDTVPAGPEFARAAGAEQQLQYHENVVRVADLDRGLLQGWVDQGPGRAPGYSVEVMEIWPEAMFPDIAYLFHVLERDMPMSPSFEPREWDAERVRAILDNDADGVDAISALAIDD